MIFDEEEVKEALNMNSPIALDDFSELQYDVEKMLEEMDSICAPDIIDNGCVENILDETEEQLRKNNKVKEYEGDSFVDYPDFEEAAKEICAKYIANDINNAHIQEWE